MLKKLAVVAGATALAGTGMALATTPAHAATHPANSVFIHGTSHLASFTTKAACAPHASASYNLVVKSSKTATPLVAYPEMDSQGAAYRFQCFPLRSGRWTYLTGYVSKTGAPLNSHDLYVDLASRYGNSTTTTVDTESVWPYSHYNSSPPGTITQAKCDANLHSSVKAVSTSAKARLVYADTSCYDAGNNMLSYDVDYLGVDGTSGIAKDTPYTKEHTFPMLDILGYDVPDDSGTSSAHAHHHSLFAQK